ncbi:MAG: sulfite exporter TauE/SafE family protein [Candidatus Helarchaeota archaeon]
MAGIEIYWILMFFISISILGNLSGTAGGSLKVPILMFFGYTTNAVAISIATNPFLSVPTSIINIKRKNIDYKISIFLIIGSFIGTFFGSLLYDFIIMVNLLIYIALFSIFLIFVSIRLLIGNKSNEINNKQVEEVLINFKNCLNAVLIGFCAGFLSTLFGIGGGLLVTPLLVLVYNFKMHKAIGTSIFVINFTSFFGIIENYFLGYYTLDLIFIIVLLGSGISAGSFITSFVFKKAKSKLLKYVFVVIVLTIAVPLLWISYFIPIS